MSKKIIDINEKQVSRALKQVELKTEGVSVLLAEKDDQRIDVNDYTRAVWALLRLAQTTTSGGRMAAQVLLSAYNGFDFQLDVAGLGSLDRKNFVLAMTVLRGRYDTGIEPHAVTPDGSAVFQDLRRRWGYLHVEERGKIICPSCDGRGLLFLTDADDSPTKTCSHCKGKGRVCRCMGC